MIHLLANRLLASSLSLLFMTLVAILVIFLFRIKSPRIRSLLWLLVLAKPLASLLVGTPFLFPIYYSLPFHPPGTGIDSSSVQEMNPQAAMISENPAFKEIGETLQKLTVQNENPPIRTSLQEQSTLNPSTINHGMERISFEKAIVYVWLAGVGIFVVFSLRGWLALHNLVNRSRLPLTPRVNRLFKDLCMEMKMKSPPSLRVSRDMSSPALLGWFRPVILIPAWLDCEDFGPELRWILRHELMHQRMKDPLGLLISRVVTSLFFFHPLAWYASREWAISMELACDRAILRTEDDSEYYAKALYKIVESMKGDEGRIFANALFATRSRISRRIMALLNEGARVPIRFSRLQFLCFCMLCVFVLSCGFHLAAQDGQKKDLVSDRNTASIQLEKELEKEGAKSNDNNTTQTAPFRMSLFEDFTGKDNSRPEGWKIVNAPNEGFWYKKDGNFATGNGDDIHPRDGWSYAIYQGIPFSAAGQTVNLEFTMLQGNGRLAVVFGWKDSDNLFRAVLDSERNVNKRSMRIEQVKDGEEKILAVFVSSDDDVFEPFDSVRSGKIELRVEEDRIIMIYNNARNITTQANFEDLKGGLWGLAEWYNYVLFHYFWINDVIPAKNPLLNETKVGPRPRKSHTTPLPGEPEQRNMNPPISHYQILIATGLASFQEGQIIESQLLDKRYTPVDIVTRKDGKFDVTLGKFLSREEAETASRILESEDGLKPQGIVCAQKESTGGHYKLLLGDELDREAAADLEKRLRALGYSPIEIVTDRDLYAVRVGMFGTEKDAMQAEESLRSDGFSVISRIRSPEIYTVLVREWKDKNWADLLKRDLENHGYYPVIIYEIEGKYGVCIAQFTAREDAEKLEKSLVSDGYSATVIPLPLR